MNPLLEKYNEYKSLSNYRMEYKLADGTILEISHKTSHFPHLIGLHKLDDIPVIRQFNDPLAVKVNAKYINRLIKKQTILTDDIIRNSKYFPKIENRYENFTRDNLLTVSYTDAIIDFDASKIGSILKASHILFESKNNGFNHLCIAEDLYGKKYAESFFYNPTDLYIRNQTIVKVARVRIFDQNGKLYFEDNL